MKVGGLDRADNTRGYIQEPWGQTAERLRGAYVRETGDNSGDMNKVLLWAANKIWPDVAEQLEDKGSVRGGLLDKAEETRPGGNTGALAEKKPEENTGALLIILRDKFLEENGRVAKDEPELLRWLNDRLRETA